MTFEERLEWLKSHHEALITKKNQPIEGNGVYERYENPILTGDHAPLFWRYDLNKDTNPYLMERFAVHAAFNSGAIKWNGKYILVVRVEGADRKSFFAVAERVLMEWIISVSGTVLSPCRSMANLQRTSMTCV